VRRTDERHEKYDDKTEFRAFHSTASHEEFTVQLKSKCDGSK